MAEPGRSCPLAYRYRPEALAAAEPLAAETLYVAGGIYGNRAALAEVARLAAAEPAPVRVCLNGDFHWFDAEPRAFAAIERARAPYLALRGNVETEVAADGDDGAGCGCAYPEWVEEATVTRSNAIMERLRTAARPLAAERARLAALPMWQVFRVGALRVAVVHGDGESLAGWGFAAEALAAPQAGERIAALARRAAVEVFASAHTCLPVAALLAGGRVAVLNNGAAGMPNFRASRYGVVTRIATKPSPHPPLYGARLRGVYLEALAVRYDHAAFLAEFERLWPPGSPADRSYRERIEGGPDYRLEAAARAGFRLRG